MESSYLNLVTVLGPTAVGKTNFAARLALEIDGEIVSADSRQVYRGMDIGTGKDYGDYVIKGKTVPYYLVDIMDAGYEYNVFLFKQDFVRVFKEISSRGKLPVLCGGTGMYIEAILKDYQLLNVPVNDDLRKDLEGKSFEELKNILKLYGPLHNQTDTVNRKRLVRAIEIAVHQSARKEDEKERLELSHLVLGLRIDRMLRRERITERLKKRLDEGLVDEVARLMENGISQEKMEYYGLEYRFVSRYLNKDLSYDEMVKQLNTAIHQFAKRQMTYFRGMERRGIQIHWLNAAAPVDELTDSALDLIRDSSSRKCQ